MRVTLVSYGTAGDVRPLVALAVGLRAAGHEAVLIGDRNSAELATSRGFAYHSLAGDLLDMMKPGGSISQNVEAGRLVARSLLTYRCPDSEWLEVITRVAEGSDLVLGMPIAGSHAMSAAQSVGADGVVALLQPLAPTRAFAPAGLGALQLPPTLNLAVGRFALFAGWRSIAAGINRARRLRGESPLAHDPAQRAPTLHAWSPTLLPRPDDWPKRISVTGHWTLPEHDWRPDPELQAFLDAGEPPVYVGFGSMPRFSGTEALMDALLAGLTGRRVLLSTGWAGLGDHDLPDTVHRLGYAPHDRLFPLCSAVVHHCGAGTTHAAAFAGVPSIPVPFTVDQPFWAERLVRLGIAAKPIDPRRPSLHAVRQALAAVEDPSVRARASEVSTQMATEDGVATAVGLLEAIARG